MPKATDMEFPNMQGRRKERNREMDQYVYFHDVGFTCSYYVCLCNMSA